MRPTAPFSYFCSKTVECQIIASNEISFHHKMNETSKSSIRQKYSTILSLKNTNVNTVNLVKLKLYQ